MNHSEATNRGLTFEDAVASAYGGIKHLQFRYGELVPRGAVVVDVLRLSSDGIEAIECKSCLNGDYYNLAGRLARQINDRNIHLPVGIGQRIVFEDFGYDEEEKAYILETTRRFVCEVYPGIPIDFLKRDNR